MNVYRPELLAELIDIPVAATAANAAMLQELVTLTADCAKEASATLKTEAAPSASLGPAQITQNIAETMGSSRACLWRLSNIPLTWHTRFYVELERLRNTRENTPT